MSNAFDFSLPESPPYQCDHDFLLVEDGGRFCWEGVGDYEGDHCGFESHRRIEDAAADAIFRLSIADGEDVATAIFAVYAVGLPTAPSRPRIHRLSLC